MVRWTKRLPALLLALMLCAALFPSAALAEDEEEAGGAITLVEGSESAEGADAAEEGAAADSVGVISQIEATTYVINGKSIRYSDFTSSPSECWAYAQKVYRYIWGMEFSSDFSSTDNLLHNLSDSELTLTAEHLKAYVSAAELGSCLRICNAEYLHGSDGWGHTQIIVQKDANGFTVIQGGLSNYPYCNEAYYTWSGYVSTSWLGGKYSYIKYIKWPGSHTYSPGGSNPFKDVEKGKYYYDAVLWAYNHDPQITGGTGATTFSPNATCTREQIVTFLWKACGAKEPQTTANTFSDVKADMYYYKAVLWAMKKGITGGIDATHFGVGRPCTREQAMTFLWKAAGAPEPTTADNPFTDVVEGKWYCKAILWAVENGITSGVSKTEFGVGQTCTRAQIVTFLYKAKDYIEP